MGLGLIYTYLIGLQRPDSILLHLQCQHRLWVPGAAPCHYHHKERHLYLPIHLYKATNPSSSTVLGLYNLIYSSPKCLEHLSADSWVALEANSLLHLSNSKATVALDITTLDSSSSLLRTTRVIQVVAVVVAMQRSPRDRAGAKSASESRRSQTSPFSQD